mmetsp:Transcript_19078/g.32556  ORF Transcript_19078/g.32556 Transcript_19078/m.32556 type:complete len:193 (-) Transcript_19078:156-734(-)
MDETFTIDAKRITSIGHKIELNYKSELLEYEQILLSLLGFLVVVPSNPENAYFQIVEAILNFLKKEEWGTSELSFQIQIRVLGACVRYLASQQQDTLPYRIANVESNDQIFIGNEEFVSECEALMDYCFEQLLEIIQKLDAVKDHYYALLFNLCLESANILMANCQISQKINGFVNKMFKMSDKYLVEHNKI